MKIASWNVRGLNLPLKQNGVCHFIHKNQIDILAVLETKCSIGTIQRFVNNKLFGWEFCENFDLAKGGRIAVLWNPAKVEFHILQKHPQVLHCKLKCKVSSFLSTVSFVYAANSLVSRREVWMNLVGFGETLQEPWLVLGDFNNVLKPGERCNGRDVSPYEIRNFVDCCSCLGLEDLQSFGQFFTWTNNSVLCKLDRAMGNHIWHASGIYSVANFLPAGCLSDHSPCLVSLFSPDIVCKPSFRFFNMWTQHSDFAPVVAASWRLDLRGSAQFRLCRNLKKLKGNLKLLNQKHFGHIIERTRIANSDLNQAEIDLQQDPSDIARLQLIGNLRKNAWFLNNAERSFLQQKAKCDFLINSDKCSRFFHSMVKRNYKRNFVANLLLSDGTLTTSNDQVVKEFIDYFTSLLGTGVRTQPSANEILAAGPVLSGEKLVGLTAAVSDSEIKNALDCIGNNKSPGPDGYSALFFKSAWSIVGQSVCAAVCEFFDNSSLLKQINHSVIALIPKTSHASSVGDYRPISCCNVIYKLISKILAARMGVVINDLVDRAQSAFLPGRLMADNIHLMQELIRGYNKKRSSPRCIIKIDLRKAFDSISWDFLKEVLEGLLFPEVFVRWVMECVSSPSYSISINGNVHGFFKGKRGLRQGDPLSPFLFILCLEYLSRLIQMRTDNSEFNYHPKCGALKITHLAFADDLMLMARGDSISIGILLDCLRDFGLCSGLHLNISKSNIYMAGLGVSCAEDILSTTHLPLGTLPFRYLGIPMAAAALKAMDFWPLFDSINSYLNVWKGTSLSYAGRVELIRSVLQGVKCFWLSIFPIPAAVRAHIIGACRKFLWGTKAAPVAWAELCLPKSEGGLSIRDLKAWNLSLLSKTLWNICAKKDSLWIQWVDHQYLRGSSIWDKVVHVRDSPLLKNILCIRDKLLVQLGSVAENHLGKWHGSSKGFGGNAYDFFRRHGTVKPWANIVWDPIITPKHSFILWLGLKGRLSTKDRLVFLENDPSCTLCNSSPESKRHLFFECMVTKNIWTSIRIWIGLRREMSSLESGVKWLKKEGRGSSWLPKARRIAFASTVYHIWTARNKSVFEGLRPSVPGIVHQIKAHVYRVIFGHFPHVLDF